VLFFLLLGNVDEVAGADSSGKPEAEEGLGAGEAAEGVSEVFWPAASTRKAGASGSW